MHPRGGGDAAGTTIAPAAYADVAELDSLAGGLLPPASHGQHRPGEEDRRYDQADGQQQGL
jgi:hypothetical protein